MRRAPALLRAGVAALLLLAVGYTLRAAPEDFLVEELPLYEPAGEGGHTFVWVEKRLRTTEEAARTLARAAGVAPGEVGYAGRKDRVADARQWLSVPGLGPRPRSRSKGRACACSRPGATRTSSAPASCAGTASAGRARRRSGGRRARRGARRRAAARGLPNRFGPSASAATARTRSAPGELLAGGGAWPRDRRAARFLALLAPGRRLQRGARAARAATRRRRARRRRDGARVRRRLPGRGPRGGAAARAALRDQRDRPVFGTRMTPARGAPGEREQAACAGFGVDLASFRPPPRARPGRAAPAPRAARGTPRRRGRRGRPRARVRAAGRGATPRCSSRSCSGDRRAPSGVAFPLGPDPSQETP